MIATCDRCVELCLSDADGDKLNEFEVRLGRDSLSLGTAIAQSSDFRVLIYIYIYRERERERESSTDYNKYSHIDF